MREIVRLQRQIEAERAAWAAYEATRDVAKAAWLERGGARRDAVYETARRAAWGVYEDTCTAAYQEIG